MKGFCNCRVEYVCGFCDSFLLSLERWRLSNWNHVNFCMVCSTSIKLMPEGFTGSLAGQRHWKGLHVYFGKSDGDYRN